MANENFKVPGTQVKKPASQPPNPSESFGGPLPDESVFDKEQNADQELLAERNRLDRIGVKSDDLDVSKRGVNVVAEGHQGDITGQVVLKPRPETSQKEYPGTYKINNYGDQLPAKSIASLQSPAPAQPAPAPPKSESK